MDAMRTPDKADQQARQVVLHVVPCVRCWRLVIVGSPIEIPVFENRAEALRKGFFISSQVRPSLLRLLDQGGAVEREWVYGEERGGVIG